MKNGLPSVSPCRACTKAGSAPGTPSAVTSSATSDSARPLSASVLEHAVAADVGDQLVQRVTRLELGLAVGAEQQRAARLRRADEVTQELERRAVGPVEVVEDQHERRLRAGLAEQRGHRVEEAQAVARPEAPCVLGGRRAELAEQDPELGGAHAEALAQRVERGARGPAAHHLHHRLVGRDRLLVEAPVEHQRAVVARAAAQLGGQAGLADAGVAGQQDELARAGDRLVPVLLEHVELPRAADERVAAERGGQRRRPGDGRDLVGGAARRRRAAGASPRRSRSCTAIAAAPGVVPSSSRSRMRSSSKARSASAGLPAASWTSISSRCDGLAERHRRDRGASGLLGRPELAAALAQARLGQHLERAHAHGLQLAPALGHPRAVAVGQEGLQVGRQHVAGGARRRPPSRGASIAASASRGGRRRDLDVDVDRPGGTTRSSERPASAPSPSARRSFESSALSALSAAAGGRSGHSRSISSARPQSRSRLSTR